ncbi:cAMP-binding domain of CRP or a regulatory subunit of cAMP-dependent protein kinases [Paracoccus halophilus]|uniref:cAMP-binding domain of CRP or a regulatory subunit of cAMP-dependent protein kinases n=1 Tax=Paracoccus halophilus TaxID=376733 RepID=A0A1I0TJA1_9RHOB|nr:Crp/Fnr family transcriptional regulator [Paracoccus halophilus]SFA51825.1 cAMP-binding domain of CRP or a regulatory subunit of cAMP-dependent protein kinases [Paracoccus halophilus]
MQLTGKAREMFMAVAREQAHQPGETLILEADAGRAVFLMLEGEADVLVHSPEGRMVIYSRVSPGELVGVLAAVDGGARSASVVARDAGRAAWVAPHDFQKLQRQPDFAHWLHLDFAERIRSLSERVYEFGTLLVRERLVRELLRLAQAGKPGDGPHVLDPAPGHMELAARIATHREAVSREISRLTRLGLLRRKGRALHIPSCAALAQALDQEDRPVTTAPSPGPARQCPSA